MKTSNKILLFTLLGMVFIMELGIFLMYLLFKG